MKTTKSFESAYKISRNTQTMQEFLAKIEKICIDFLPDNLKKEATNKLENLTVNNVMTGSSYYDYYTNTVNILNRDIKKEISYVHEFFHAIGTKKDDKNTNINIGLQMIEHNIIKNNEIMESIFGQAINEGANTYFTEKALQNSGVKTEKPQVASFYCFCTNVFDSLCSLVGEEEMKNIHFSGETSKIFDAVRKSCNRVTDSKIIKLILSLDSFFAVSQVNRWVGLDFSVDAKMLLTDAYKSLVDLFIFKHEKTNNIPPLSQLFSGFYLVDENKEYFEKMILPSLQNHYEKRMLKTYLQKSKNATHIDYESINKYMRMFLDKIKNGEEIDGKDLPEKLKCGEFYNYLLICVSIVDENYIKEGIKSNDIQRVLTKALFEKENEFMPKGEQKKEQTVISLLSSKIAVRAGIEISDSVILDCLKHSEKLHLYLIDTDVDYYKSIFNSIEGDVKFSKNVLEKCKQEVFTTRVEQYKLNKMIEKYNEQKHYQQNQME